MTNTARDLTPEERGLLSFILSAKPFPGASELATQVEGTAVAGGPATFLDLKASRIAPISRAENGPIPVRAYVNGQDGDVVGEVLVWVQDGYLSGLEFAWYTDEPPSRMPSAERVQIE